MKQAELFASIARSLSDRQRPGDEDMLKSWLEQAEENRTIYEELKKNWRTPFRPDVDVLGSDEVRERLMMKARKEGLLQFGGNPAKRIDWFLIGRAAAMLVVLAVSAFLLYTLVPWSAPEPQKIPITERANAPGRRSVIHLKDGSTVYLNAGSSIRYPEVFSDSLRIIELRGEAFFDVAHNPDKPFVVHCEALDVIALGTTFNVDSYGDMQTVDVSLFTGKVQVIIRPQGEGRTLPVSASCILAPGQQVSLEKSSNRFSSVTGFSEEEVVGWKMGILQFSAADLQTLIRNLELWYGVSIRITNPGHPKARAMRYTGKFRDQNLQNVLESVGFVQHFSYVINEDNVTITFK